MCQGSCLMGFLLDHKSLKIGALNVERSFTCCRLVELCVEVVNFKNEIDKEEEARMFGEEFHTLGHIFFALNMRLVYKCRMDTLNFRWLLQNWQALFLF